jgi:SH3 domain-containing YSC84-like protein 1
MKRTVIGAMTLLVVGTMGMRTHAQVSNQQADRIKASADVLGDVRGEPDKDIPRDLWEKAQCVVVIPGLKKAAFGFGGEYGKGMMSCRTEGTFGAPVFMELEKGSWGFQIGGESIDLVLLVMNQSGMKKMLGDKVSLGADVSLAAGPVGRNAAASTDAKLNAEILSYSRAQGRVVFFSWRSPPENEMSLCKLNASERGPTDAKTSGRLPSWAWRRRDWSGTSGPSSSSGIPRGPRSPTARSESP